MSIHTYRPVTPGEVLQAGDEVKHLITGRWVALDKQYFGLELSRNAGAHIRRPLASNPDAVTVADVDAIACDPENAPLAASATCPYCRGVAYCKRGCKCPRDYDTCPREVARAALREIAQRAKLGR